jgi:hypothetical protein
MICEPCQIGAGVQKANILIAEGRLARNFTTILLPGEGHDGCKGCTCQHLPVGSVEFLGSNPSRSIG